LSGTGYPEVTSDPRVARLLIQNKARDLGIKDKEFVGRYGSNGFWEAYNRSEAVLSSFIVRERGVKDLDSVYPALVSAALTYCVCGSATNFGEVGKSLFFRVLGWLSLATVGLTFLQLCSALDCIWLQYAVTCCAWLAMLFIAHDSFRTVSGLIFASSLLTWFAEMLGNWYPYDTWHGVSTVYLSALVWCLFSRFCANRGDKRCTVLVGGASLQFALQWVMVGVRTGSPALELVPSRWSVICDELWLAVALNLCIEVGLLLLRRVKYKVARPYN
jgi:hypothetical protein